MSMLVENNVTNEENSTDKKHISDELSYMQNGVIYSCEFGKVMQDYTSILCQKIVPDCIYIQIMQVVQLKCKIFILSLCGNLD